MLREVTLKDGRTAILRHVEWRDLDDILDVFNSVAEEEMTKYLGVVEKRRKEDYVRVFSRIMADVELRKEIRIVAEVESRVVGYVSVKVDGGSFGHRAWLGILVKKEFRDLGLGTELMGAAIEESRKRGLKLLLLETSSLNARAIRVFKKVGFREVGRIPKGLRLNKKFTDTIIMALVL